MWPEIVEYLKDATVVANIQKSFGVKIHYAETSREDYKKVSCNETLNTDSRNLKHDPHCCPIRPGESKENGYIITERKRIKVTNSNVTTPCGEQRQSTTDINTNYTITNYFWYYLFLFGTELGDEIFYSTFIPFWFWNIDATVGRRIVLVWAINMTIGQMLKDIISWPRPACPPAIRLQTKWSEEYGMPSTHAMIGISIPFSVVLFTMNRYTYPIYISWTIAVLWCTLVCVSRLYLGMHTILDILAGLILAVALMVPLVPFVDIIDCYIFPNIWSLAILVFIGISAIIYYPSSQKWTPTRGDTTMVVSVTTGLYSGTWLNYKTGAMLAPANSPPYPILWPSYQMFAYLMLRTMLGFSCVLLTRTVCKSLSYETMCAILKIDTKNLMREQNNGKNKNKVLVDLIHKYMSCFMIGFNTVYFLPIVFTMLGIERPTFYAEI